MIARSARAKARLQAAFHFGPSPATSAAVAAWSPRSGARNCSLRRKRSGDDRQDDPPVLSVRDPGTSRCKSDGTRAISKFEQERCIVGSPKQGRVAGLRHGKQRRETSSKLVGTWRPIVCHARQWLHALTAIRERPLGDGPGACTHTPLRWDRIPACRSARREQSSCVFTFFAIETGRIPSRIP